MQDARILLIEDDKDLSDVMKDYLKNEGYHVTQAYTGTKGIEMARKIGPTLIILDIMLPEVNGIEVCRAVRQFSVCPILVLSAKSMESDKLITLGMGADDYMTKPFSLPELVARVKSHIRRFTRFTGTSSLENDMEQRIFGSLTIIPSSFIASVNGKRISLTSKEFKLLDYFSAHPSQVFTKKQLMEGVWGSSEYFDDNTVAVYVGRLREKLEKENVSYIKTVWGVGYKWEV